MSPALFNAAERGDLPTVKALRESGVDVIGCRTNNGMSCIMLACRNDHVDLVDYLLEQGANPNDKEEEYGGTCLMAAVYNRHPDCVRCLIDAGADVEYAHPPRGNETLIYTYSILLLDKCGRGRSGFRGRICNPHG